MSFVSSIKKLKTTAIMSTIYQNTIYKKIYIMATLPREIEIEVNGTQKTYRVIFLDVFSNIHHLIVKRNKDSEIVKQVVTMI